MFVGQRKEHRFGVKSDAKPNNLAQYPDCLILYLQNGGISSPLPCCEDQML